MHEQEAPMRRSDGAQAQPRPADSLAGIGGRAVVTRDTLWGRAEKLVPGFKPRRRGHGYGRDNQAG